MDVHHYNGSYIDLNFMKSLMSKLQLGESIYITQGRDLLDQLLDELSVIPCTEKVFPLGGYFMHHINDLLDRNHVVSFIAGSLFKSKPTELKYNLTLDIDEHDILTICYLEPSRASLMLSNKRNVGMVKPDTKWSQWSLSELIAGIQMVSVPSTSMCAIRYLTSNALALNTARHYRQRKANPICILMVGMYDHRQRHSHNSIVGVLVSQTQSYKFDQGKLNESTI